VPIRDTSFGSSVALRGPSTQQADQELYARQQQIESFQSRSLDCSKQSAAIAPSNGDNSIQQTEHGYYGQTSTHPSVSPGWLQPFHEWLPTRRPQIMSVQGLGDPLLCRFVWVRLFDEWLQLRLLLSNPGFKDLVVPPRWNVIFDSWLQQLLDLHIQGHDSFSASTHTPLPTGPSALSTSPRATSLTPDVGCSYSTSSTLKIRKRIKNVVSRLPVEEIQEACRRNGVEETVIARIAVVFPDVVSRDHLKLSGQLGSSAGGQREHQGYMEFAGRCMVNVENVKGSKSGTCGMVAGQVQRYYCKLCGRIKRPRWKNSKDLLGHVWDTHFDPSGDGKLFLVILNRSRD
jgi:hypothetical protein